MTDALPPPFSHIGRDSVRFQSLYVAKTPEFRIPELDESLQWGRPTRGSQGTPSLL